MHSADLLNHFFSFVFRLLHCQVFAVKPFNATKSVHNTTVERQWRGTNNITKKWKAEFKLLASFGAFEQGDRGDMFSLTEVYEEAVADAVDRHYEAMRLGKKRRCTANPDFPSGLRRKRELYEDFEGHGTQLSVEEIRTVAAVGAARGEVVDMAIGREVPEWEVDPLVSSAHREARTAAVESLAPLTLAEKYVAHRSFTRELAEGSHACDAAAVSAAVASATGGVNHLRGMLSSAVVL